MAEEPKHHSSDAEDNLSHLLVENLETPWYKTLIESVRELINPPQLPPLEVTSKPVAVKELEVKWYVSFYQNVKDAIFPPKLPPLEVTSKPVPVKDIWGLYGRQKKSFLMSTGFQSLIVAGLFILGATKQGQHVIKKSVSLFIPLDADIPQNAAPVKKNVLQGGGGGGDRSPLPASFGKLPKIAPKQFTPPVAVYNNMEPKLMMDPSIVAPPDLKIPQVNASNYGDPFSKFTTPSNGTGSGGGIGSGKGGGVGSGTGPGLGRVKAADSAGAYLRWVAAFRPPRSFRRWSRNIPRKPARRSIRAR